MTEDLEEVIRKWCWWRVADGIWKIPDVDWLSGRLEEMVGEYGGYSQETMLERDYDGLSISVYSLSERRFSKEQLQEFAAVNDSPRSLERDDLIDEWAKSKSPLEWLWYFNDVYPSSHLVYVHYKHVIEAHGIFCKTFKDMLDVMDLLVI